MKQKLRKSIAWLLTLAMLFTMLPGAALAAEAEHLCSCGTDDESIHATTCAAYVQPENPVCYCVEPCTEANEWCDVCYFDVAACAGSDEVEATGYATTPTYIASLGIAQDAHEGDAKSELSGHTIIDYDLNKGCGSSSDYVYMGYKTTTDPSQAITGIFIRTGENPPASATFDGVTAYLVGGSYEANTAVDNVVDLNEDAGGAYIYVYVTRDTSRAPVTEITFSSSGSKSGYTTPNVDLNQGVGGSDDIYLHYKQYSATAYINYYYLSDNFTVVHKQVSGTLKHHLDKMTATPSGASDVIYNGKTAVQIGWREDPSVQNQGESLTTPSVTLETSGKNYYAAYRLSFRSTTRLTFDANGGSGAPSTLVRNDDTRYVTAGKSAFIIEKMAFTIPSTKPTHADKCQFLGWSTNRNATTAAYQPGQTIQVDLDTTLYAVYQQNHSFGSNGFCTKCDAGYQPAVLKNGYYQISNAGQLFWFANHVNTVDRAANAVLTADIDLENRPWTPIGSTGQDSNNFRGHFDGQGHTIEGLYVEGGRAGLGFFGEVRTGTVENFTIYGEVVANTDVNYVGGVIGSACGLNSNAPDHNGATIRNITSYVNLTAEKHGIGMVGGFIGYANHETLIENCAWYGTFDAGKYRVDSGAGGFIGRIYDTATVTIRNCAAYGTVKTAYQSGTHDNYDTIYIGGFLSYSPSGAKTVLENNLWAGQIINNTNLTDANAHLSAYGTMNSDARKTNCYALKGTPVTTGNDNADGITPVTAAQLQSGEVAYKLGITWGQNLGENGDAYPVLGGAKVYSVTCGGNPIYSNSDESYTEHTNVGGFCAVCGAKLCDHSGNENLHTDCTVDFVCSVCGAVITEAAAAHTPGTDDGDCSTAVSCTVCGGVATPANDHDFGTNGTCGNDGCTVIGYKLYIGGVQFTSENLTINGATGTAVYDPETNTLTLNNYAYTGAGYTDEEGDASAIYYNGGGSGTLKLVLVGESVVTHTGTTEEYSTSYGMKVTDFLEISGTGSLKVVGGEVTGAYTNSYGLCVGDDITIWEGSLIAIGGNATSDSFGVSAGEGVLVNGGTLTAIAGNAAEGRYSYGVEAYGLNMGEGIGILTPVGGWYSDADEGWGAVLDASDELAKEVKIGAGHTVSVNPAENGTVTGTGFYAEGDTVTLTVTPNEGYGLETLTVDGEDVTAAVADGTYTFTMPAKAVAVTATFVQAVTDYDLWVGGEQVTSEKLTITDENGGTAAYDPTTNTLTLDGYSYEGAGYENAAIYYSGSGTLKLVLVNESTVTHAGSSGQSYGIYANNGSITISGSGSLTVIGGEVNVRGMGNSYGIYVSRGDLTILGGTVTATGGKASGGYSADSRGIYVRGMITISGGTVTATGGEVVTDDDDTTVGGSSGGICAYGKIHISGGEVNATGGEAYGDSSSVSAYVDLTLGEGIGILTPMGGRFDADKRAVVDAAGNIAAEVKIAEMPDPVKVQLKLTKEFNDWGKADGFTFNLAAVTENAPMPASPSATATEETPLACFGEITFTAAGIYEYTITEVDSGIPGVTYDTSAHEVVVTITENAEDNKLIAEVEYDGGLSLIITNTYTEATLYNLWIGGTQVTSHNAADVFGDGKVSYDAKENTLTLDGYTYTGPGYTWEDEYNSYGAAIYYGDNDTLELVLVNDSTVIHADGTAEYSSGIYADNGSITVSGSGSLKATGGTATGKYGCSYGVFANGNINVSGGTVEATGSDEGYISYGVCTYGTVSVSNNGSLTGTGGTAEMNSYGVLAYEDITVIGSSLTGTGGTATGESSSSYGVYTNCNINVSGGSLSGTSGNAIDISRGVRAYGKVSVSNNGSLTGTGGTATGQHGDSYGVYVDDGITVIGSSLTGTGGTATGVLSESYGVYVSGGNINVSGGSLSGTSGNATIKSYGVLAYGGLTMGEGIGILTPVGGSFDAEQKVIVDADGNIAKTVVIAEKPVTPYDLWVGGAQFTSKNLTINGTTGTATYDPDSNTLTLDGYTYEGAGHTWEEKSDWEDLSFYYGAAIYYSGTETLNLVLNGENTATHTGSADMSASYGLYAKGNVVVSEDVGGGSLTATGGSHGVYVSDLTMGEGTGILTPAGGSYNADKDTVVDAGGNPAKVVEIGITCDHSGNENQHTDCTKDLVCSVCSGVITEARDSHAYGSAEFVWQADFSAAKVTVTCGICEDVEELDCEISSQWDGDMNTLTFTATAGEYTDTQTIRLAVDGGKLTITNSAAEAGGKVDMFIMVAGYTGGKMNGCQVIEDVTGVTERALTVSGDTFNVFFLKPGTCAPLSVCAEL